MTTVTPGQASYEARLAARAKLLGHAYGIGQFNKPWAQMGEHDRAHEEAGAQAAIAAGGWDALSADIESLAPGDGVSVGSTILAQVCRAVTARLTGARPQGEVSVWIDEGDDDGGAKVTVAWGAPREAEKAARGE